MTKTYWYHTKCGGKVDVKKRRCTKCGHKWNWFGIVFDPVGLRQAKVHKPYDPRYRPATSYASWADKVPYVGLVASKLPNWPRWARITSFLGLVIILSLIFYFTIGHRFVEG